MSISFKIGTDPEFFLYDKELGVYVSAHDKVPGNKKKPVKLPDGSHVQADGTAVEFNIEPAESGKEFSDKIESALNELRKIIPSKYKFCFESYIKYTPKIWKEIPEKAKELGCDPDFLQTGNLYVLNKIPDPGMIRTGSGHIHIGWTKDEDTAESSDHFMDCVGVAFMSKQWSHTYDYYVDRTNGVRQQYYGAPGSFRCKPYGVELRAFSNKWVNNTHYRKGLADYILSRIRYDMTGLNKLVDFRIDYFHQGYSKEY